MILNPYIAGNPLKDQASFFGREDIVREVLQMLRHPDEKAIVLYGQRRIGKTTILLQVDQRLATEGQFTPIYFDLQDRASSPLPDVLYKLAQTIATRLGTPLPSVEKFDDVGNYFRTEFLPQATQHASPDGLVVLFDEFDVMDTQQKDLAGRMFFPYLRTCLSDLERVKFVFVIGRRPEELSTETLSTFKGIRATRVSVLDRQATESVIRQSEIKKSLLWTAEAVEKVWAWTQGHTYFTQLLCSVVWESIQESAVGKVPPLVQPTDVDNAISESLKHGANAFHWIWDGLPPAERVVMAAMAEAEGDIISQENIENILNNSGVRLVVRELKLAPATLVDWELLRPANDAYRFTVPLLHHWVKTNRPLMRVKEELDRLDPLAENLFRSGQSYYSSGNATSAIQQLRQALTVNPNHLKSRLLLGRILLEQGKPETIFESAKVLEEAHKYDASAAQADLIKTLLAVTELQTKDDKKIEIYDHILQLQPTQPMAIEKRNSIWRSRGEAALQKKGFTAALKAFGEAGDTVRIEQIWRSRGEAALQKNDFTAALKAFGESGDTARIEQIWRSRGEAALQKNDFTTALKAFGEAGDTARIEQIWRSRGEAALQKEDFTEALKAFGDAGDTARIAQIRESQQRRWRDLGSIALEQKNFPKALELFQLGGDDTHAEEITDLIEKQSNLAQLYQKALGLLHSGQLQNAKPLFAQIVAIDPDYKEATRYLYTTVRGDYAPSARIASAMMLIVAFSTWVASCYGLSIVSVLASALVLVSVPSLAAFSASSIVLATLLLEALGISTIISLGVSVWVWKFYIRAR